VNSAPFQALLQQSNGSRVPGEMILTTVSYVCCERLHCLAERSHFVTDDTFGLFKHHLGGHQSHASGGLFVNGCKYKSLISTMTEFLNLCQVMTNVSLHFTIVLQNNYTLMK